jgi:hypothetical protein
LAVGVVFNHEYQMTDTQRLLADYVTSCLATRELGPQQNPARFGWCP